MQAKFNHADTIGISTIEIAHRDQVIVFSASVYQQAFKKGTKNGIYEPFDQINKYWRRIDEKMQDTIFNLFVQAKEMFNEHFTVGPLILNLRPIVNELIKIHDTEEFERWAQIHAGIWIPEELEREYKFNHERPGSREQTYLVSDYWELAFMVLKLRVIAPIWGEFVETTKKESGAVYRDLNAYYVISKSSIESSPALKRLNDYISKNVKQDEINIRSSIDGIGSDLFQTNLIANTLVRFLVIASLTREPNDTHLVQVVHRTLRNRMSQNDNHQNAILPKSNPNENSESEDSSSRAEIYKNKPLVPPGEFTAIEKYTEYVNEIAARLMLKNELTDNEMEDLEKAIVCAEKMESVPFEDAQIKLIQWTVNPIIPARSLLDINKSSIIRLAGIAQFLLWQYGFKELSGIPTARSMNAEGYGSFASESRAHIPKDLADKLNLLYPYFRRNPNKKNVKVVNEVTAEIMALSQDLSAHTWFLNISDSKIEELKGSSINKTHRVGYDIRIKLAEYAIYLQERNKEFLSLYNF